MCQREQAGREQALYLSCLIDAKEGRDVATVDIPGAFMQADMDELVFVNLMVRCSMLLSN